MKLSWENPQLTRESLDQRSELSQHISDGFQYSLNAYSMANHSYVIGDLLNILKPSVVTEVGVFKGEFTRYLLNYFHERKKFHLIDIQFDHELKQSLSNERNSLHELNFHEGMSSNMLRSKKVAESNVIFLDGDHNYETVDTELKILESLNCQCIILDDVGWPFDVWDTAYVPENLIDSKGYQEDVKVSPFSGNFVEEFGLSFNFVRESNLSVGLKTAIDQFLQRNNNYVFFSVPAFFGIGILVNLNQLRPFQYRAVVKLLEPYEKVKSLVSTMELNRLMMLMHMQESGKIWQKQQDYIKALQKALKEKS